MSKSGSVCQMCTNVENYVLVWSARSVICLRVSVNIVLWLLSQKNLSIGELAKNEHSFMNEQVQLFRESPRVHQCRWVQLLLIKWDGDNDTTISFWWWILKVISSSYISIVGGICLSMTTSAGEITCWMWSSYMILSQLLEYFFVIYPICDIQIYFIWLSW